MWWRFFWVIGNTPVGVGFSCGAEQHRRGADLIAIAEHRDHPRIEIDGDDNRPGRHIGLVPVPFAIFDRAGNRQDALDDEAFVRGAAALAARRAQRGGCAAKGVGAAARRRRPRAGAAAVRAVLTASIAAPAPSKPSVASPSAIAPVFFISMRTR